MSAGRALAVRVFRAFSELSPLREQINSVNLRSRSPCGFATFEYLANGYENDEHVSEADQRELIFLTAFDGDELVAYLPLKRVTRQFARCKFGQLEFMLTHDNERPGIVSLSDQLGAARRAFFEHLFRVERGFSVLEFSEQGRDSTVEPLPDLLRLKLCFVRRIERRPLGTIPITWSSGSEYFRSFNKKFRSNVGRQSRKLLTLESLEFLRTSDPRALPAFFEAYLQLEAHSWKAQGGAAIARHPKRVQFFRRLLDATNPMRVQIDLLLVGQRVIAGFINGSYEKEKYALEIAFDEDYRDYSPGLLTLFLAVKDAIDQGFAAYHLLQSYGYFKSRWGAEMVPTQTTQLFKLGSLPFFKAKLGDLRRRFAPPPALGPEDLEYNVAKRNATLTPDDAPTAAMSTNSMVALERAVRELDVQVFDRAALLALLPFKA
jgi:hypothetical protein